MAYPETGAGRHRAGGLALIILSSVCFGGSGPFGKALIEAGLSPLQAVWMRIAGAAAVLIVLSAALRGRAAWTTVRASLAPLAAYGVVAVAGCQGLYFLAASRLPVGVAILLEFCGPVLVLVWMRLVRRTPVRRSAARGVAVAMVGLALVVQVWQGLRLDALGLAAGLGAAACQAAYFLLLDRMGDAVDPLVTNAAGGFVAAVLLILPATPWAMPWHVLGDAVPIGGHTAPGWVLAAWIIGISTVLAYVTGNIAVRLLSAQIAGALSYTEAVAATLIAWIVLGEHLTAVQLAGGAIVLTGAYLAQRSVTPSNPTPAAPDTLPLTPEPPIPAESTTLT
ncbi:EamA family transporter [Actinomadura rupiterrae]|uniref:EamA family transporter n=1 Tax=Actinomadura rupiterrae TaxID=559627 RepID=UPI0020A3A86B|nr:EamA family transporter [Actinomadura rupiterrae]MCP2343093.1 drug/metabolite transporter (DMT)-like permease [Actinomadura rupiterrae]